MATSFLLSLSHSLASVALSPRGWRSRALNKLIPKTVVPSQLISERGSNLVVINPGSANVQVGFAQQQVPFSVRHCIAQYFNPQSDGPKHSFLQDEDPVVASATTITDVLLSQHYQNTCKRC